MLAGCALFSLTVSSSPGASKEELAEKLALDGTAPFKEMNILFENTAKIQSEAANADKASQVRMIRGEVVAKNRLLFEVRFDHPPVLDRSSFCLYIDIDNDTATGRQDEEVQGTDLMVALETAQGKAPYVLFKNPDFSGKTPRCEPPGTGRIFISRWRFLSPSRRLSRGFSCCRPRITGRATSARRRILFSN